MINSSPDTKQCASRDTSHKRSFMLRLMLLRHAKSNSIPGVPDLQRPLTERGYHEAALVGQYLVAQQLKPELAIVSSATRTQQTWIHLSAAFDTPVRKITEERIYEASVEHIVHVIRHIAPGPRIVLVVGHNPGLFLTTQYLSDQGDEGALDRLEMGFPPASLTVMDFDVDAWESVGESGGTLLRFETPGTMVV